MRLRVVFAERAAAYIAGLIEKLFVVPNGFDTLMVTFEPQRIFLVLAEKKDEMFYVELQAKHLVTTYKCISADEDNRIIITVPAFNLANTLRPSLGQDGKPAREHVELRLTKDADKGNLPALMIQKTVVSTGMRPKTLLPCRVVQNVEEVVTLPDSEHPEHVDVCFNSIPELRNVLDKFGKLGVDKVDILVKKDAEEARVVVTAIMGGAAFGGDLQEEGGNAPGRNLRRGQAALSHNPHMQAGGMELSAFFRFAHNDDAQARKQCRVILKLKTILAQLARLEKMPGEHKNIILKVSPRDMIVYTLLEDSVG
ncbi:unnamed protein product, partial [Amoebophrya sp. A25]|eukprot:GSA25T00016098001.1